MRQHAVALAGALVPGATEHGRETRDRFMDLLRVASLAVVVAGHWLVVIPSTAGGVVSGQMLYDVQPAFWPVTWVFNVLPLFFFVGGFANFTSYSSRRRARTGQRFHARRLTRLLRPTLVFLGVWTIVEVLLWLLGIGGDAFPRGMRLGHTTPFAALWFLGVYLVVVVLSPITIRLHLRFGVAAAGALLASVAIVDALAFALERRDLLALNVILVWMLPHQLGYAYADGQLRRLPAAAVALAGTGALVVGTLLTSLPWYGRNMLDTGTTVLGITDPTLPVAITCVWVVAGALLARPALARLLAHARAWRAVARCNSVVMTVFLWHMTAYFAVVVALAGLGAPMPSTPDAAWWLQRPLYLALPAAALVPLVLVFARFEADRSPRAGGQRRW